jgi:hypothetical protein
MLDATKFDIAGYASNIKIAILCITKLIMGNISKMDNLTPQI